jgi:5'(3')-deoxyribonucleotidase
MIIAIDFDNTLVDTDALILEYLRKTYIEHKFLDERLGWDYLTYFVNPPSSPSSENLTNIIWNTNYNSIFHPRKYELRPFVRIFLTQVLKIPDVQLILATQNPNPQMVMDALESLKILRYFSSLQFCIKDKDSVSADYLVDDWPKISNKRNCKQVLWIMPTWARNKEMLIPKWWKPVDSLEEALEIIEDENNG